MRQRFRQKMPDVQRETPTLSEMNSAPAAFHLNQSGAVCLPVVTESQKLIWVNSKQIDPQLNGAAELDKAFDRFPYLTQKQTAELAQRCSLHPDQVKVWFMVQRLRYGISWDYKDICDVRAKFKSSQEKEEVKEDRREKRDGKEAGEVSEEDVWADEQLERKMKQSMKREKTREVEEDKRNAQKKRKRMTVTDKMGKKRTNQQEGGIMGEVSDKKANKRLPSIYEWPEHKSFVVLDETLDASPSLFLRDFDAPPELEAWPETELHADSKNYDDGKRTEFLSNNNPVAKDGSRKGPTQNPGNRKQQQDSTLPAQIRTKTQTQLAKMKVAFSYCQYPDSKDYDWLAMLIGIPRGVLVHWFSDMRYSMKRGKPGWMNEEQYRQVLANIVYRQFLNAQQRLQSFKSNRKANWKPKLEEDNGYSVGESVQGPSEQK